MSRASTARKTKLQRRKSVETAPVTQNNELEDAYRQLLVLQEQLTEQYATSLALKIKVEGLERLRPLVKKVQRLEKELKQAKARARRLNTELVDLKESTSWKMTKPLRHLSRLTKGK